MSPYVGSAGFGRRSSPFNRPTVFRRVPGHGPTPSRCMLIGEKPGFDEATRICRCDAWSGDHGQPFTGPSGQTLNAFLYAANVPRETVFVTNCVHEFTEYSKPTRKELARDKPYLVAEIESVNPEVIGLVGAYAVEWVLGKQKADMERTHGVPLRVEALFGGEMRREGGWLVMPMYHPAGVLHAPEMAPVIFDDYSSLSKLLDGEISPRSNSITCPEYRALRTPGELRQVVDGHAVVAVDTEVGWDGRTWSVQLSCAPGSGWMIRTDGSAKAKSLLDAFVDWLTRERPTVILHNVMYDLSKLRQVGIDLVDLDLDFVDTMVWAYQLCVEPQSLKSLAYRHCMLDMVEYDEVIGDVGYQIAFDYLYKVLDHEWPDPEPVIERDGGGEHIRKPQNVAKTVTRILSDIANGKQNKSGEETDPRKRWRNLRKKDPTVTRPVVAKIGDMRIADLGDIPFDRAMVYGCRDSDATVRIAPILEEKITALGLADTSRIDHDVLPMLDRMQETGIKLAPVQFWNDIEDRCYRQMDKAKYDIYKATGRDINPGSGDQVADLLYGPRADGGLGLTPPMLTDGGKTGKRRGSTNDKCLENLLAATPVTQYVMDYREADKVRGTYVVPLRQRLLDGQERAQLVFGTPGEELPETDDPTFDWDRVRGTIRATRVPTGRLAIANPNLMAIPIRTELGKRIRYGFLASDGWVMYDADLSQIEMRMFAHMCADPKMIRIFQLDQDIHKMTAAEMFSVSVNNIEKKDARRDAAKQVGFGIINGISPPGLLNQMILYRAVRPDGSRWTLDDCEMMIREWFKIYTRAKIWQDDCRAEAMATGVTREPIGGRIRFIPQIWASNRQIAEEAGRVSFSHKIQASAQSYMKIAMKIMWDGLRDLIRDQRVKPLLQVHDEALFEVHGDEETRTLVETNVIYAMETAVKLRVPVEAEGKFGMSWAEAH